MSEAVDIKGEVSLMKLQLTSNVMINRSKASETLREYGFGELEQYCKTPADTDAIRRGIAEALRGARSASYNIDGKRFRVVSAGAKANPGELKIDFHIREHGAKVDYKPVGSVKYEMVDPKDHKKGSKTSFTPDIGYEEVPQEIKNKLASVNSLKELGKNFLFDNDIRTLVSKLVPEGCKIWDGTWLLRTEAQKEAVRSLKKALQSPTQGSVGISKIDLKASAENYQELAQDLELGFVVSIQKLRDKLEEDEPNLKTVKAKIEEIEANAEFIALSLGISWGEEFNFQISAIKTAIEIQEQIAGEKD